jgi:hypothetical protein
VGDRRRPAVVAVVAQGDGEGEVLLGNTRTREVHWGLGKLAEWLASGERERGRELKAAAMAGAWRGWQLGWRARERAALK